MAYEVGGGVEFGRINVDMRYGGQFKKSELSVIKGDLPASIYKTGMNQWQLNVCYLFLRNASGKQPLPTTRQNKPFA